MDAPACTSMTAAPSDPSKSNITMMSRIHPSSAAETTRRPPPPHQQGGGDSDSGRASAPLQYTVWKRSSMGFQGTDGFSVYDAAGALVFRLDNYSRRRKIFAGELLLMDGRGVPLLALRPQILSMHDQWNCYKASEDGQSKRTTGPHQLFSMRKCSVLQKGYEAEVSMSGCRSTSASSHGPRFWVEGSFRRRSCKIRKGDGVEVARITRKKAAAASNPLTLGDDVFRLVIEPDVDCTMIMAFVVVLDRICWRPHIPMICSS